MFQKFTQSNSGAKLNLKINNSTSKLATVEIQPLLFTIKRASPQVEVSFSEILITWQKISPLFKI